MTEVTIIENFGEDAAVEDKAAVPPIEAEAGAEAETEAPAAEDGDDGEPAPERDEKARPKAGDGVQRRFDELTRARREAERQAEYWKGIATQTAQEAAAERPDRDEFAADDEYTEALAEWKATQAATRVQRQAAEKQVDSARLAVWHAREAEARAAIPDYDTVVPTSTVPIKKHVVEALFDSEAGPALAYHLAKHPDVAAQLNALSPTRAAIMLGRLETTLTAPAAKAPSNAPAPVTPIAPQASGRAPDLAAPGLSQAEYMAARRAQGARFGR